MLSLTPAAARAIHAAAEHSGLGDDWALRLAADVDDAGALRFGMGFDETREADLSFVDHGVALLVGAASRELLTGVTLDFVAERFVFLPPAEDDPALAGSASGCGSGGCGSCGGGRTGGCS